jgi:uncharacterized protein YjbI with pentapeptide repeats
MKAEEVLRCYAAGERDFRRANLRGQSFKGKDLSGADFTEADIRGANFTGAVLRGVNFAKAKAGLQKRWIATQLILSLIISLLSGVLLGFAGGYASIFLTPQGIKEYTIVPGVLILVVLAVLFTAIVRQGYTAQAFGTVAVAAAVTLAVTFAVTFADTVAFAVTFAIAGTLAGALAFTVSFAVAIAVALVLAVSFAIAVAIAGTFAVAGTLAVTLAVTLAFAALSIYMAWRAAKGDEKFALLGTFGVTFGAIGGTSFRGADLTAANFTEATLKSTRLMQATLLHVCWSNAKKLDRARTGDSYLKYAQVLQLATVLQGQGQNFDRLNLSGVNLKGANLQDASFVGADLSQANLQNVDLSRAVLKQTQLDGTDLTNVNLTGACIEDWGITSETKLNRIQCRYVFMRYVTPNVLDQNRRRKPDNWEEEFEDGDFADFIQPIVDTLDLYHNQGVDPRAIAIAFKNLAENHPEAELEIVAMEKRGQDKFLIRAKTAETANKSELNAEYFSRYNYLRALPENSLKLLLAEKDSRIRSLENMVETALKQPKFYAETYQHQGDFMPENSGININAGGNIGDIRGIVGGDVSGVVNLGEISGNVSNTINQLQQSSNPETVPLADLLKQLQSTIEAEPALTPQDKTEALEQVGTLAKAGQNPQDGTLKKLAATAIKILKGTIASLPSATQTVTEVTQLVGAIATLLAL